MTEENVPIPLQGIPTRRDGVLLYRKDNVKKQLLLFVLLILFAGLKHPFAEIIRYKIAACSTDNMIDLPDNESDYHLVYINETATKRNKLLVLFPGTGHYADVYELFDSAAANLGFHVIGLAYKNRPSVNSLCSGSPDKMCYENVRMEIITGEDRSDLVDVDTANSIENRLHKVLVYLHKQNGSEGWDRYYTSSNDLVWNNIIVTGHSQGGGHAGLIAKYHVVEKVIFFNSPSDGGASWINNDNETSAANYYAFFHWQNNGAKRLEIYTLFGMADFGDTVNSDDAQPPYNDTRMIYTNLDPGPDDPHVTIIGDPYTPLDSNGIPVYKEVWEHLLTHGETVENIYLPKENCMLNFNDKAFYINNGKLVIDFNYFQNNELKIKIYNLNGKCVLTDDIKKTESKGMRHLHYTDISQYVNGLYLIKISSDDRIIGISRFLSFR